MLSSIKICLDSDIQLFQNHPEPRYKNSITSHSSTLPSTAPPQYQLINSNRVFPSYSPSCSRSSVSSTMSADSSPLTFHAQPLQNLKPSIFVILIMSAASSCDPGSESRGNRKFFFSAMSAASSCLPGTTPSESCEPSRWGGGGGCTAEISIAVFVSLTASLCAGIAIGASASFRISGEESGFLEGSGAGVERMGERRFGGRTVDLGGVGVSFVEHNMGLGEGHTAP